MRGLKPLAVPQVHLLNGSLVTVEATPAYTSEFTYTALLSPHWLVF